MEEASRGRHRSKGRARCSRHCINTWPPERRGACIVIDDASGLSSSMVPWFVAFYEVSVLVFAAFPQTLAKKPLQRLWTRFDRVNLGLYPHTTRGRCLTIW